LIEIATKVVVDKQELKGEKRRIGNGLLSI
jgi:hypothetical protein